MPRSDRTRPHGTHRPAAIGRLGRRRDGRLDPRHWHPMRCERDDLPASLFDEAEAPRQTEATRAKESGR
jgi:hypothetical protein